MWIGHYRGFSGFATATREYFKSIKPYYDNLYLASLESLEDTDPFKQYMVPLPLDETELKIVNHQPITDPEAEIYFSVWEFNKIPEEWVEIFNNAKVIMTQSNFCKNVFTSQISDPSKIYVVPYIIPDEFSPIGPRIRLFDENIFVFGSVFDWVPRKVPRLMVEAFIREFKPSEPVRLVLKTELPFALKKDKSGILQLLRDDRIVIKNDIIYNISEFYRGLDAYISCTAGEGWGQTLSEAMACGAPTIGSRHSGNLDFMNDNNSYLVEVENWTPSEEDPKYLWKKPKLESIQQIMRQVYEEKNTKTQKNKVKKALKIKEKCNRTLIGKQIKGIIDSVLEE